MDGEMEERKATKSVSHQIKDLPLSIPLKVAPSHPLPHSQKMAEQFFHQKCIW